MKENQSTDATPKTVLAEPGALFAWVQTDGDVCRWLLKFSARHRAVIELGMQHHSEWIVCCEMIPGVVARLPSKTYTFEQAKVAAIVAVQRRFAEMVDACVNALQHEAYD